METTGLAAVTGLKIRGLRHAISDAVMASPVLRSGARSEGACAVSGSGRCCCHTIKLRFLLAQVSQPNSTPATFGCLNSIAAFCNTGVSAQQLLPGGVPGGGGGRSPAGLAEI